MPDQLSVESNTEIEALAERDKTSINSQNYEPDGMGLCLSGGGYKSCAYQLGALIRLHEAGLLTRIKRTSSVSGGSIANAFLGLKWNEIDWTAPAENNFFPIFADPLKDFLLTADIDVGSIAAGLFLPFRHAADGLRKGLKNRLFGDATLQDLPDSDAGHPRFLILSTNFELNTNWRFCRNYAANYLIGEIKNPTFKLADIVTSSAAFPPFYAPFELKLGGQQIEPFNRSTYFHPPYNERLVLADAGIYDNMGLEPIWKRYGKLLVSNAGDPFDFSTNTPKRWDKVLRRTMSMMHRQAENNRVRWLMSLARNNERQVAYWSIRKSRDFMAEEKAKLAAEHPVRLKSMSASGFSAVATAGYLTCDHAISTWLDENISPSMGVPDILN